jgi:hypothetical protein
MNVKKITISIIILAILVIGGMFLNSFVFSEKTDLASRDKNVLGEDGSGRIEEMETVKKYVNSFYGFSFEYPKEFTVGQFGDGAGESIVLQSAGSSARSGVQIFVSPVDSPIELTPSVIQKELPGTEVKNAKKIELDGKAKGIIFESNNPAFDGKSAELWFYYSGNVYQVTSYPEGANKMTEIMGTWKFQ